MPQDAAWVATGRVTGEFVREEREKYERVLMMKEMVFLSEIDGPSLALLLKYRLIWH